MYNPRSIDLVFGVDFINSYVFKLISQTCFHVYKDRAERHDFWLRFLLFILLFFSPLFLGGKRKGEQNNQSCGQKSCLSARSYTKQKLFWLTKYLLNERINKLRKSNINIDINTKDKRIRRFWFLTLYGHNRHTHNS